LVHIHARSLAMAELKQVSLCLFGLTKTSAFLLYRDKYNNYNDRL